MTRSDLVACAVCGVLNPDYGNTARSSRPVVVTLGDRRVYEAIVCHDCTPRAGAGLALAIDRALGDLRGGVPFEAGDLMLSLGTPSTRLPAFDAFDRSAPGHCTLTATVFRPMRVIRARYAATYADEERAIVDHSLIRVVSFYIGMSPAKGNDPARPGHLISLTLENHTGHDLNLTAWIDATTTEGE